jgi:hypothetical protein
LQALIFSVVIGIVVLIFIIASQVPVMKKIKFLSKSKLAGLDQHLSMLLYELAQKNKVKNFQVFIDDMQVLNYNLNKAISDTYQNKSLSDSEQHARIFDYYRIKQLLDLHTPIPYEIKMTQDLPLNKKVIFYHDQQPSLRYSAMIRSHNEHYFLLAFMEDYQDQKESFEKWVKKDRIHFVYFGSEGEEYLFTSSLLQPVSHQDGVILFKFVHTKNIQQMRLRRYRRKNVEIHHGHIYSIQILHDDEMNLPLKQDGHECTIVNLSLGGCAIKTDTQKSLGSLVCITFTPEDEQEIVCFGRVLMVSLKDDGSFLTQIQFTRSTKHSLNKISHLIYKI